jgi:hypothetical protein
MEGSMALLWINRWIGNVTRTKHRDTRLEYRASESKMLNGKREKGSPEKVVEEHPKNLSLLTSPRDVLFAKKQNATTNNGCNTYYYDKRIGMSM